MHSGRHIRWHLPWVPYNTLSVPTVFSLCQKSVPYLNTALPACQIVENSAFLCYTAIDTAFTNPFIAHYIQENFYEVDIFRQPGQSQPMVPPPFFAFLCDPSRAFHQRIQIWRYSLSRPVAGCTRARFYSFSDHLFKYRLYRPAHCSRSKFLSKLLKTFDKTFREIFPVFISTKRREKPSAFFDNNFVNNAYFSEAASSSSSHLASSSSKAPISSRMTCLCLWSSWRS